MKEPADRRTIPATYLLCRDTYRQHLVHSNIVAFIVLRFKLFE